MGTPPVPPVFDAPKEDAFEDIPVAKPVSKQEAGFTGGAPVPGVPYVAGQAAYPPQPAPPPGYGGPSSYNPPPPGYGPGMVPPQPQLPPQYKAGMVPPEAIVGNPGSVPLSYTFFGDTPAPYHCPKCGKNGLSRMEHHFTLAACLGCVVTLVGVCFLLPAFDCLWSKTHYCIHCGEKVGAHEKSDFCAVADPPNWTKPSFAVPASAMQT